MIVDINTYQQFLFLYKKYNKIALIFYRDGDVDSKKMVREFIKYGKEKRYEDIIFILIDYDVFDHLVDIYDISEPPMGVFIANKTVERVIKEDELFLVEEFLDEIIMKKN